MKKLRIPHSLRLADFIRENEEPILAAWESFARSIWPGEEVAPEVLQDHAWDMLLAVIRDMESPQSISQQSDKSMGIGGGGECSERVDSASDQHAMCRVASGFDLRQLVAEYRALRASVIHLWTESVTQQGPEQLEDLIRFNEAIDQLLAKSVQTYWEQVDHSREIFLGILCHDLRSPLQAITMLASLISEAEDIARTKLMAGHLATSVHAIAKMISDLGDFTGIRLGAKMELNKTAMDLGTLCREVLDEMEASHPHREFLLKRTGDLDGVWDRARLRQMLTNLLRNAVQHGRSDTPVVLAAESDGGNVNLAITNQGESIPRDRIQTIFEPMRRYDNTASKREPGSIGLGLYIAREVCSAHGGTIDVESADTSTTFTVSLATRLAPVPQGFRQGVASEIAM